MGNNVSAQEKKTKNRIVGTYGLSREDLDRLVESLQRRFPDGVVDTPAIRNTVRATFYFGSEESKRLEDSIMRIFDRNDNDCVEILEYIETILEIQHMTDEEKLEIAFAVFDVDESGYLDRSEVSTIITSLIGLKVTETSDRDKIVERLIRALDTDGDGKIDLEEFKQIRELDQGIANALQGLFMSTF